MAGLSFSHPLRPTVALKLWDLEMAAEMTAVIRQNAAHIRRGLGWPAPDYSLDHARAFIRNARWQWAESGIWNCGIWEQERLVGGIGMNTTDAANRSTHLGYWLAETAQGRGIMTDACRALTDDLLTVRGYNRVVIAVRPDNARSRAIAKRLRFTHEGVLRQVHRDGDHFVDWVIYAMLAQDWPAGARDPNGRAR